MNTAAKEGSEPADWTPEFPGQRPPFGAGNEAALTHGARSERRVAPLAAQIARELLEDADAPAHLREPVFAAAVQAWAHAEAVCRLLREWVGRHDLEEALVMVTDSTEDEARTKDKTARRGTARTLPSVLEMLRKWESTASSHRSKLGIDPASAARVRRDLATARYMDARPLEDALDEMERRRALTAGGNGE